MQAMWHRRRSEAPKSQGCAAKKKRVEIKQVQAQITSHRFVNEAARHAFNCADDGHAFDLPNGSGQINSLKRQESALER